MRKLGEEDVASGLMATAVGLDRDLAFPPTVTIVIASYYALFAVMGAQVSNMQTGMWDLSYGECCNGLTGQTIGTTIVAALWPPRDELESECTRP